MAWLNPVESEAALHVAAGPVAAGHWRAIAAGATLNIHVQSLPPSSIPF
jgi:hypothetical protein